MHSTTFAETQMNGLWDYIDKGAMDASIQKLRSLDVLPEVIDYVLDPNSYVFPQGDAVEMQSEIIIPENKIAVVALAARETLNAKLVSALHPLQKQRLQSEGISDADIDMIESALTEEKTVFKVGDDLLGMARVDGRICKWGQKNVLGTPSLLYTTREIDDPEIDPSMSLHEVVHIAQRLTRPHLSYASRMHQDELEAYAVPAASIATDHRIPFTEWAIFASEIDLFRKKYIGEDSYEPTPEFWHAAQYSPVMRTHFINKKC